MENSRIYWLGAALLVVALAWAHNVKAETNLYLGAWSNHFLSDEDYNERHDLIGIEYNSWFVGRFINSHDRETFAVAHKWSWNYHGLEAGVLGGAMYGYTVCWREDNSSKNICPLVSPFITWDTGVISPHIFLFGEALAISIRVRL